MRRADCVIRFVRHQDVRFKKKKIWKFVSFEFTGQRKKPTSAVKFGSIVVSFCAAEKGRTETHLVIKFKLREVG